MQTLVALAAAALIVMVGALMNTPAPPPEVAPEPVVAVAPPAPEMPAAPAPSADNAPSGG
jgi:hypothetical protein